MSTIPSSPHEFFTKFVPERFAALPDAVRASLSGKSSPGALVCRVEGEGGGTWSLRLRDGQVSVTDGADAEAVLQITVPAADFEPILIEGARAYETANPVPAQQSIERQLIAFKALAVDADRARLIRAIPGTMVFAIKDGDTTRRLALTPGNRPVKLEGAECRVDCLMSDFRLMQTGKAQPMQLIMQQKMKMVGNAQIPMALSTVFV